MPLSNKVRVMYHSCRKTQDSPLSFSHSNHHGPVVDFVQLACRLKFGLYLLPENWAPVESKCQKLIRAIDVLFTLAINYLTTCSFKLYYKPKLRKMSPHSSFRKSECNFLCGFQPIRLHRYRRHIFVWQRLSHNFIISEQRGSPS